MIRIFSRAKKKAGLQMANDMVRGLGYGSGSDLLGQEVDLLPVLSRNLARKVRVQGPFLNFIYLQLYKEYITIFLLPKKM